MTASEIAPIGTFIYRIQSTAVTRLLSLAAIPPESHWGNVELYFRALPPVKRIVTQPGAFLLRGQFTSQRGPLYSLAHVHGQHDLTWLSCEPRPVQHKLAKHGVKIPPGAWHALRGAMLLAVIGG